jgi:hypothetical protein
MGEERKACRILVGKPEGKRALGRTKHTWENNIKMELRELGWSVMNWINLAWDRDRWQTRVNTVMNSSDSLHLQPRYRIFLNTPSPIILKKNNILLSGAHCGVVG